MAKNSKTPSTTTAKATPVRPVPAQRPAPQAPSSRSSGPRPAESSSAAREPRDRRGWSAQVGDALVSSVRTVRDVLPARRFPVYLAAGALLVTGLIDPPVALGAGLAFEALRRWEPSAGR